MSTEQYTIKAPGEEDIDAVRTFRRGVYAEDGVIFSHDREALDESSWHIVARVESGAIVGCLRFTECGGYADAGGWAVGRDYRRSKVAVNLLMLCYHLGQHLGGVKVRAYATTRHESADILQRFGGFTVYEHFDAAYGCHMHFMLFDTANPPAKYRYRIARLNVLDDRKAA